MPETAPPPLELAGLTLAEIARFAGERRPFPVDSWHPARSGDSAMRIARDGRWFHEGAPIARPAMVRLFASLLRREPDGGFVLVTPAEKLSIAVEDAPFVAVELVSEGQGAARRLAFRLNTGEPLVAGPDHPIAMKPRGDATLPYLQVRRGLDALIARPIFYELAEIAIAEGHQPIGLWSDGAFFALEAAA